MVRSPAFAFLTTLGLGALLASSANAQSVTWWQPTADKPLSFHWLLSTPLDLNDPVKMGLRDFSGRTLPEPDVYDIDGEINPKSTVDALHARGKKVICYIDAGVYETYRSDAWKFQQITPQIWGKPDAGWEGHYWLDIRRVAELEPVMKARMQMCKDKGFDAIEPDEIDAWENSLDPATNQPSAQNGATGFAITYADQLYYNRKLAQWAHEIGMSIGQKGDIIQTIDLVGDFDWTLNEECNAYSECIWPYDPTSDTEVPGLQLYTQANKAVFIAEYKTYTSTKWTSICQSSRTRHFNTVRFKLNLNGPRQPCVTTTGW
ncbi:endo alpha-1,4 polygalactosaminidase [Lysobacter tyrosinilyticus]